MLYLFLFLWLFKVVFSYGFLPIICFVLQYRSENHYGDEREDQNIINNRWILSFSSILNKTD